MGIVKKNGIMIVDVALKLEREEGMGPEEAVVAASHQRLRPILMTTACAFLGGVPMILGYSTDLRAPPAPRLGDLRGGLLVVPGAGPCCLDRWWSTTTSTRRAATTGPRRWPILVAVQVCIDELRRQLPRKSPSGTGRPVGLT